MREPGRRVTIYDVAARAGVSISTVSLAMNAPHRVRETTRTRIMTAAARLGYRTGVGTPRGRAGTRIAVAAPFSSYPTYLRRLTGVLARTRDTAIEIVVHDLDSAAGSTEPLLDALPAPRGLDGLIVMGVPLSGAALRTVRETGLPVVLVDVRPVRRDASAPPAVVVDDLAGGRAIGRHLRDRGHRHAIFLHEPQLSSDYRSAAMERAAGFQEFIRVTDAVSLRSAAPGEVAAAALRAHPSATAVIAHHDDLAVRVWNHLHTAGAGPQRYVALVGYDDGTAAEVTGLTTVRQPFEESGAAAVDVMIDELSGAGRASRVLTLEPTLIVRSSTHGG